MNGAAAVTTASDRQTPTSDTGKSGVSSSNVYLAAGNGQTIEYNFDADEEY